MKIVHICIGCHYTKGLAYQENKFAEHDLKQGHEVFILTDKYEYKDGRLAVGDNESSENLKVMRFDYSAFIFKDKFKKVFGLLASLNEIGPDLIFFHGITGLELITVYRYLRKNRDVKLYIDSHEDYNNSGKNLISRYIQYKFITNLLHLMIDPFVEKYFYVTNECYEFCRENIYVNATKWEYLPLGGDVLSDVDYKQLRHKVRSVHAVNNETTYLCSGKFDAGKKLLITLQMFEKASKRNADLKLLIAGVIDFEENEVLDIVARNKSIVFLGWLESKELTELLCASDVYVQLGTQSATMQIAACLKNALILQNFSSHSHLFGHYSWILSDISDFEEIAATSSKVEIGTKRDVIFEIAKDRLDYGILSNAYKV